MESLLKEFKPLSQRDSSSTASSNTRMPQYQDKIKIPRLSRQFGCDLSDYSPHIKK